MRWLETSLSTFALILYSSFRSLFLLFVFTSYYVFYAPLYCVFDAFHQTSELMEINNSASNENPVIICSSSFFFVDPNLFFFFSLWKTFEEWQSKIFKINQSNICIQEMKTKTEKKLTSTEIKYWYNMYY